MDLLKFDMCYIYSVIFLHYTVIYAKQRQVQEHLIASKLSAQIFVPDP